MTTIRRLICALALSTAMAGWACAEGVEIEYYAGFVPHGDGTPFSNPVAHENSPYIRFAQGSWWQWRPFGLGAFGARMTGTLHVARTGRYPLALTSDDGSRLYIDDRVVLDNGDAHGPATVLTIVRLSAGYHAFVLNCWQNGNGASGVDLALPDGITFGESSVLEPGPMLQELLAKATGAGPGNSLPNKIVAAQAYYAASDGQAACAVLTAFVHEVRAQRGKQLSAPLADELAADALRITTVLGCD